MTVEGPEQSPLNPLTTEPTTYGEGRSSVLTPMGEVESLGGFARGLGQRRVKIMLAVFGAGVLLLAVVEVVR